MIQIHPVGTPCKVGHDKSIEARIIGVKICQGDAVLYEIAWVGSTGYIDVWMLPCEIMVDSKPSQKIGFLS